VRHAGPAQDQQLTVEIVQGGVADAVGVGLRQRRPGRQAVGQQRVLGRPGGSRVDDLGHRHARLARPHGHEGLVLDLLQPGEREGRPGVPVEHEPARLGQDLGVGRVPSVDLYAEPVAERIRPGRLDRLVLRHPPDLSRRRVHVAGADAEILEQELHITGRGQAQRRAENEPDDRGRRPADGQASENVDRQPVTADRRGQGHQGDEDLDEALHAAGQVGQRGRRHGHEQGDLQHRECHVVAVDDDAGGPAAAAAQQRDQDPAYRHRADHAEPDIARDLPAAGEQGHDHQDDDDAEGTRLVHHGHQPRDAPRRRVDDLHDGLVDTRVKVDDKQADHERENGEDQARPVASAPPPLPVADRGEKDRAPAPQRMRLRNSARTLDCLFHHAADCLPETNMCSWPGSGS
jgi:hypothetical protein